MEDTDKSFIFSLPKSLLANLLSKWCSLSNLMKFDSSVSNFENRPNLLNLFAKPDFVILSPCIGGQIWWICKRNVKFVSLTLTFLDLNLLNSLEHHKEKIIEILIKISWALDLSVDIIANFINSCPLLTSLKIFLQSPSSNELMFCISKRTFQRLVHFEIHNCESLKKNTFKYVAVYATNLKTLLIQSNSELQVDSVIMFFNESDNIVNIVLKIKSNNCVNYNKIGQNVTLEFVEFYSEDMILYAQLAYLITHFSHLVLRNMSDVDTIFGALNFRKTKELLRTLVSLTLASCTFVSDISCVQRCIRRYTSLRLLQIVDDSAWTFETLTILFAINNCITDLELINLNKLSTYGAFAFMADYPFVKLHMFECLNISD
jgi:hypothetical protein